MHSQPLLFPHRLLLPQNSFARILPRIFLLDRTTTLPHSASYLAVSKTFLSSNPANRSQRFVSLCSILSPSFFFLFIPLFSFFLFFFYVISLQSSTLSLFLFLLILRFIDRQISLHHEISRRLRNFIVYPSTLASNQHFLPLNPFSIVLFFT